MEDLQLDEEVENAYMTVRASDVREEILRALNEHGARTRPSKILETVQEVTGTSSGNFYMNLGTLRDKGIVSRMEGPENERATLYSLTEIGRRVINDVLEDEWETDEDAGQSADMAAEKGRNTQQTDSTGSDEIDVEKELLNIVGNTEHTFDSLIKKLEEMK